MTRSELLNILRVSARKVYDQAEADSVAHLLLEKLWGLSRLEVVLEPSAQIETPENLAGILADLEAGKPAQYIAGEADFCGRQFHVREGVLIPRPETEELVKWIVEEYDGRQSVDLLDIGTGSGALAVSLAAEIEGSRVTAVDISAEALEVAHGNAERNGVHINFLEANALSDRFADAFPAGGFDVIVSNPPYIPQSDFGQMHINVKDHEPHIALFVPDDDALRFYRSIAEKGLRLLRPGGSLYFEIYEKYGQAIYLMLAEAGYVDIELRKDINDKDRMIRCRKA